MSAGGRLAAALAAALLLHAAALSAAAAWAPRRPALPPVLVGFSVSDAAPGEPARAAWRVRAAGVGASAAAVLRVEAAPAGGGDTVELGLPIPPVGPGAGREGGAALALPAGAAGPWVARARVGVAPDAAPTRRAEAAFWVDDGRAGDLSVEDPDAGGTTAVAGGAVRLSWTRRNRGAGWLRGGGRDAAELMLGGEPVARAVARGFGPLPPGGSSPHTLVLAIPAEAEGVATLRLTLDAGRALAEPHGPENQAVLPLLIEPSPNPDLAAVRLDVGEAATLREDAARPARGSAGGGVPVLAGAPVPVRLVVENLRPAAGPAGRFDAVYLSADAVLDASDEELLVVDRPEPLAGRARSASTGEVVVPEARAGSPAFLIGVADAGGSAAEGDPSLRRNNAVAVAIDVRSPAEEPEDQPLGEDDAPPRTTVAWIPHDAFKELLARERRTVQPAVQAAAVPAPEAPLRDATSPPVPPRPPSPPEALPAEEVAEAATPPPPSGTPAGPGAGLPLSGPAEPSATEPDPRTVEESEPQPRRSADPADPAERPSDTPAAPPAPPPAPEGPAEPTSAPRSDSAADPTAAADATTLRPGRVEVGPGLTVDVARPRIDPVAVISSVIRPPRVAVTFDTDGTVLLAQVVRSAGSNAVDAPILRSLYRWRASGERLEGWDGPRTFEFTFLFDR